MTLGLGVLGLASRDFWAMTPVELAAAVEAFAPTLERPPGRGDLEALMQRFPDRRHEQSG
jgi:uncharacterized phage protein (TIGR02216 family)